MSIDTNTGRWSQADPTGADYVEGPNLFREQAMLVENGAAPFHAGDEQTVQTYEVPKPPTYPNDWDPTSLGNVKSW